MKAKEYRGETADGKATASLVYQPGQTTLPWNVEWNVPGIVHGKAAAATAEEARQLVLHKYPGDWKWSQVKLEDVGTPLE